MPSCSLSSTQHVVVPVGLARVIRVSNIKTAIVFIHNIEGLQVLFLGGKKIREVSSFQGCP